MLSERVEKISSVIFSSKMVNKLGTLSFFSLLYSYILVYIYMFWALDFKNYEKKIYIDISGVHCVFYDIPVIFVV